MPKSPKLPTAKLENRLTLSHRIYRLQEIPNRFFVQPCFFVCNVAEDELVIHPLSVLSVIPFRS